MAKRSIRSQERMRARTHARATEIRRRQREKLQIKESVAVYDRTPNPTRLQEVAARVVQAIEDADDRDGFVTGPLTVAAEMLAQQLCRVHDLPGIDNEKAVEAFLVGCWGQVAHAFPSRLALPGYHEHLTETAERVNALVPPKLILGRAP